MSDLSLSLTTICENSNQQEFLWRRLWYH